MSQNSRTTVRPTRRSEPSSQLLDRLHSQFPELSHDEVAHAAAGVAALPGLEPIKPHVPTVTSTPPRYRA